MSDFIMISMSGPAGSGKDYIAARLNLTKVSFASPMKQIVGDAIGLTPNEVDLVKEGKLLPEKQAGMRKILQLVGTDVFRDNWSQNVWVDNLLRRVMKIRQEGHSQGVAVTDCRFQNEFLALKQNGFLMVDVQAPDEYLRIKFPGPRDQFPEHPYWHESERNLDEFRKLGLFDFTIQNDWKRAGPPVPWEKQIIDLWNSRK